ncbi:MAG: CCA tRNA nucleotidyltransferase [Lentisphaeria bacterium]|nr:CCA tRNA nucleotidyltransferase [Lentisphaeria bacterium]
MQKVSLKYPDTPIFQGAKKLIAEIKKNGSNAYIVGGATRNLLLNKPIKDIDIVANCNFDELLKIFPEAEKVGAAFGVVIVKCGNFNYEIASCRAERNYMDGRHPQEIKFTDSFEVDSLRRDFTVNAMLFDVFNEEVIDFHNGIDDLYKGIIRTVGSPMQRFSEDYLRILRAIRFAGSLGFAITEDTMTAIRNLSSKCAEISTERVKSELDMMLLNDNREYTMRLLQKSRVMKYILPEVYELENVKQNPKFHPEGDVFEHTMIMLRHTVLKDLNLIWSVLLHDIGKKETFSCDETGIHFYSHEMAGSVLAEKLMQRLRFANDSMQKIKKAIQNHMRFANIPQMKEAKVLKIIGDPNFTLELELNRIDCISCHGDLKSFNLLLEKVIELSGNTQLPEPFILGRDLIKLGYQPSKNFSLILSEVYDLQLNKELNSKEEAIEYIGNKFPAQKLRMHPPSPKVMEDRRI